MNDVGNIKRRIKTAIKEARGINQKVVAAKIGMSTPQLSQILNDRVPGTLKQIMDIVDTIDGADKYELLTGYKKPVEKQPDEVKEDLAEYTYDIPKNRLDMAYTALLEYCERIKAENDRLKKELKKMR